MSLQNETKSENPLQLSQDPKIVLPGPIRRVHRKSRNGLIVHASLILKTIFQTVVSLVTSKQSALIPLFLGLLLAALVLVFLNSVSPLAPFVYSLF